MYASSADNEVGVAGVMDEPVGAVIEDAAPVAAAASSSVAEAGSYSPSSSSSGLLSAALVAHSFLVAAPKSSEVSVTDPEKKVPANNLKINNFVTYRVSSKQTFAADGAEDSVVQSSVLRRYNDFVWLHDAFTVDLPEILIPALPPAGVMNRFEDDFIETRRRGLVLFLQRCLAHEVIVRHPLLQTFLTAQDAELAAARQQVEAARKSTPGEKVKGWLSSASSLLSDALNKNGPARDSVDDRDCREMLNYVQQLQRELARLVEQVESLLPAQDKLAKGFGAFSVAADSLAQAEGQGKSAEGDASAAPGAESGSVEYSPPAASGSSPSAPASVGLTGDAELARLLHLLSQSAEAVRQRAHSKGATEESELLEPLRDAHRQAHAVELLLRRREARLKELFELQHAAENARAKAAKAATDANTQLAESAAAAVQAAERALESTTTAVRCEFQRAQAEKKAAMDAIVKEYLRMQIKHHEENARTWAEMLKQMEQ